MVQSKEKLATDKQFVCTFSISNSSENIKLISCAISLSFIKCLVAHFSSISWTILFHFKQNVIDVLLNFYPGHMC